MRKTALIILDGWGAGNPSDENAIHQANTPFTDSLSSRYPLAHLQASGHAVGLPDGQMGNSEVGHMHLGAGKVVWQDLPRISQAINKKELSSISSWINLMDFCLRHKKPLHLMGLLSDGGVHAHIDHVLGLVDAAVAAGLDDIRLHVFTDGRDTDPQGGVDYIGKLLHHIQPFAQVRLVSVIGRYYAMDRDQRWERTKKAYDLLLHGQADHQVVIENMEDHIKSLYGKGVTDEFLEATLCDDKALCIAEGDAVLCWNFRTDRCRQITQALCFGIADEGLVLESIDTNYVTMTRYDVSFDTIPVLFAKENIENTLGEAIASAGLTQLRMAETEKYPHVTYFFNGGRETPFDGEERCVIPSPKVATYDLQPEMSAYELTAEAKRRIKEDKPDFLCLNFANPDMVGHTGDFAAVIKAVQTVDSCAQDVIETLLEEDYQIFLTADHGNADFMINEDGSPHTAHTTNLVPVWSIARSNPLSIHDGSLCDIATWVKACLGIR